MVAALLWAAVLVPSWVRRREFRQAEQNALRLQRTLRVLAETSEVPTEVRVEATAREALAQERLLRTAQRKQEAERKAQLAEARAAQLRAEVRAQQVRRKQAALVRAAKLRRPIARRFRSLAALVFVLAFVAALVGVGLQIAGLGPALLLGSLAGAIASLGALVLLAPGRVKHVEIEAEQVTVPAAPAAAAEAEIVQTAEDRAAAAHAAAQAAAAARIERARAIVRARAQGVPAAKLQNQPDSMLLAVSESGDADAAESRRPAVAAPAATSKTSAASAAPADLPARTPGADQPAALSKRAVEAAAAAERLRRMGVVGDTSDGMLDLDAVLRTRRRAG